MLTNRHLIIVLFILTNLSTTILGMGAKCYAIMQDYELEPAKTHSLRSLHYVLSTGSPLKPSSFDYIYQSIKKDIILGSVSGGTDIIGCFMGACPLLPVHRSECQCLYLGCNIECYDEKGKSVCGERGELVCLTPFPSMPTCFLDDTDGQKYQNAYFNKYKGVWAHGDYCVISPETKGIIMLGRSDGTLNPGGVRFGSSEIYNVVEKVDEVIDSLCVSQPLPSGDERVVLFLKLVEGSAFDSDFISQLQAKIRKELSPRHVPSVILPILDIPYTHSGKKVEIAVKKILAGEKVLNAQALANPESLAHYADIPQLQVEVL